ncbi:heterokaryon incompatibility protein-domain-containing protein [Immersiella caudata]|uniref:Heterokaryon incompatibility protein-domain-containing protein n=1 Tax=Immersiella caudata TaxID=314043 RepID=A0AA39WW88_9PEZI|nr:heterokaryon incompatibility protein-domain-containing protein [Immersiella caudata]
MTGLKLAAAAGASLFAVEALRRAWKQRRSRLERGDPESETESEASTKWIAPLCEHCARIPFDTIAKGTATNLSRAWVLPLLESECPFCRLVRHAIKHKDGPWTRPGGGVSIEWETYLAPGCRPAFRVAKRHGAWIAFGDPRRGPNTKTSDPAYLCANVDSHLDIERVSSWIDHCTNEHKCILPPDDFSASFPGLEVLRLIDVRKDCVVETRARPSKYVALSYVWGDVADSPRLLSSTREGMMASGALSRRVNLPNTIRDAIDLVYDLGIQYLWVDSLCLVQDDPTDLHKGLRAMGRIYELASVTIVAACGDDANAGLPGAGTTRRKRQNKVLREVQPGVHLGVLYSPDHLLKRSVYQTRAWTMQEYLFSRRVLCFVGNKVFFRCRESERLESCHDASASPKKPDSNLSSRMSEAMEMESPLDDYADLLMYYSQRDLTKESDALRAMEGISARFSDKMGYGMLFGLPAGALDYFILFSGEYDLRRRPEFPSYSWAGWKGDLSAFPSPGDIPQWLNTHTWIVWYTIDGNGNCDLALFWNYSQVNTLRPPRSDRVHYENRKRLPFHCNGLDVGDTPTAPSNSLVVSRLAHYSVCLRFWTVSFVLSMSDNRKSDGSLTLLDRHNRKCGQLYLGRLGYLKKTIGVGLQEFILLSGVAEPDTPFASPCSAGDHAEYHVMLLEWDGDVAERRGIGKVTKQGLLNSFDSGPVWKEITLV